MTVDRGGYPPSASTAESVGDSLRETRVAAGASLEQVEADLRIKAKYLEAIEDGDTAALPSRAYTEGFLRNYATYLGLDPADTVRRFAGEQGLSVAANPIVKSAPIPRKSNDPLGGGFASAPPRRSGGSAFGRAFAAVWPVILLAGVSFAGYTGYGAARDAGLIPPEIVKMVHGDAAAPSQASDQAETRPTPAAPSAEEPSRTAAAPVTREPEAASDTTETQTAEAKPDLVGNETTTGRPDTLSYTRTGSTPYWQAKPPAVEPVDGPVSEIEPETAGLLRADEPEDDEAPSRWVADAARDRAPADEDAARIAAAARAALGGDPVVAEAPLTDDDAEAPTSAALDEAVAPTDTPEVAVATPQPPVTEPVASDVVAEAPPADLAPAIPAQPPRRFALIATADTWVQVTDTLGSVQYTGILSPGQGFDIPSQAGLRLKTGNAGGLVIEIDGQRFGPLGSNGAVMRNVVLSPDSVRASFTVSQAVTFSQ